MRSKIIDEIRTLSSLHSQRDVNRVNKSCKEELEAPQTNEPESVSVPEMQLLIIVAQGAPQAPGKRSQEAQLAEKK